MDARFRGERGGGAGGRWREHAGRFARDVRHAVRGLRRSPAFTLTAILRRGEVPVYVPAAAAGGFPKVDAALTRRP